MARYRVIIGKNLDGTPATMFHKDAEMEKRVEAATDYEAVKIVTAQNPAWTVLKVEKL